MHGDRLFDVAEVGKIAGVAVIGGQLADQVAPYLGIGAWVYPDQSVEFFVVEVVVAGVP